jgi:hypothetical protein
LSDWSLSYEDLAAIAHDANRRLCLRLGDGTQPAWDYAPEWQRSSAIDGVKFHLANPDSTPEDSHVNWLKTKEAEGWKYGPVKNPETKEHPCYVPYGELPMSQQSKDYLFRAVIHGLSKFVKSE